MKTFMQNSEEISTSKIKTATKWSFITEILARVISPIVNIVLARLLTPEAFGAVASINMVTSFADIFTDAGFQKYIVQHEFENEEEYEKGVSVAFWSNFTLSMLAFSILFIFRNQFAEMVGSPELGKGIAVAASSIILTSFSSIQMAVYRRDLNFKKLFYVKALASVTPIIVTIPLAFIMRNYWALVIGALSVQIVRVLALMFDRKNYIHLFYSFRVFKTMFSFTSWTLLESISIWAVANVDIFIVGRVLDSYYLGIYKTSMTTVNGYMGIIYSAVTPVLFASLSRYQNNEIEFRNTFSYFQKLLATFILPMGVGIFIYSDVVTKILLGSGWMEASSFIGLWGLSNALMVVIGYCASEVFRAKGKPNISLLYQVVFIAALLPAVYFAAHAGYDVLYKVRSALVVVFILQALLLVHFLFGISVKVVVNNLMLPLICATAMGVFAVCLRRISSSMAWSIVSILLCVVFYFGIMLLFPSTRKTILEASFVKKTISRIKKAS